LRIVRRRHEVGDGSDEEANGIRFVVDVAMLVNGMASRISLAKEAVHCDRPVMLATVEEQSRSIVPHELRDRSQHER
jgi:hypothetical protein